MRKFWMMLLLIVPVLMGADSPADAPTKVEFFSGSLAAAQEKARKEGKLVFVDFYASWCSPCRLMDEYTFTDPELARYMSDKYVSVKVNIDDFDGFAYKQQYNINLLPTLLILNCKGKEIERKEEGLVPSTMTSFLSTHYKPGNLCEKPAPAPYTPPPSVPQVPAPTPTQPTPPPPSIPAPTKPDVPPAPTIPEVPSTPTPPPSASGMEEGLFRFSVQRQPSKGFSVQTGAFGEYGNVLREVDKLQRLFPEQPIIVFIAKKGPSTIYKILVGEFTTRTAAIAHQKVMKDKGSPGIIKNLEFMN